MVCCLVRFKRAKPFNLRVLYWIRPIGFVFIIYFGFYALFTLYCFYVTFDSTMLPSWTAFPRERFISHRGIYLKFTQAGCDRKQVDQGLLICTDRVVLTSQVGKMELIQKESQPCLSKCTGLFSFELF